MSNAPESRAPRRRRIPLSRFWLDWRISFFLVAVCVLVVGIAVVALWGRPEFIRSGPGSSPATHRERAQFYEGLGKNDDAIREYQAALRLSPEDPALYNALALLYEKEGRFAEAADMYERVLDLQPDAQGRSMIRARIEALRHKR
ncbi:MAG: tetratricopeptide repeat protein [Candidatus Methylomirabilales bacterium]